MSLKAAATSESSSLCSACTCTPSSPAAMRRAASRSLRNGRTAKCASSSEMSDTMITRIAHEIARRAAKSLSGAKASSASIWATTTQFSPVSGSDEYALTVCPPR